MPRGGAPPGRAGAGGFTFVELMVVLAILAFAFTYAVIHLDGATGQARLSSAARQVGSAIEFLRGHAIQASRPLELHLYLDRVPEPGTRPGWIFVVPPRPSESDSDRRDQEEVIYTDAVELPPWIRFEGVQLGSREQKSGGVLKVTFSPLGEVTPNGFLVRLLSDEIADPEQASFSVEVNGLTGEVSYLPGYAAFDQVVSGESF